MNPSAGVRTGSLATPAASTGVANRRWLLGNIEFDELRWDLRIGGRPRAIETKPLLLLHALLLQGGEVIGKDALIASVWPGVTVTDGSLTTAMHKLRVALGDQGRDVIKVVHGIGYRIGVPIELRSAGEQAGPAFDLRSGNPVPGRPQWRLVQDLALSRRGDVWLASHDKTGEQRVFKFADTGERLNALKREAALSQLLHGTLGDRDGLVRVLEWNFDTRPFFIESAYGGTNLAAWAASRGGLATVPLGERLHLVARIARVVADAHERGVFHCDIKPSNVLVDKGATANPSIRLVDFGAGGLTEARRGALQISDVGITVSDLHGSGRAGTLLYAAPELLVGGSASTAADIYALGILLYQMVAGDLERPLAAGWEADIHQPLLRADIAEAAAGDAARRMPSALELAERLDGLARRESDRARRAADMAEMRRLAERLQRVRHRRPWVVVAVLSLVAGLAGVSIAAMRATQQEANAKRQEAVAKAVNQFLTEDLLATGGAPGSGKVDESLVDSAQVADGRIDGRFPTEPLVAGSIHLALAQSFATRSADNAARDAFDRAIADFERAEGSASPDATLTRLQAAFFETLSEQSGSLERARALIGAARRHMQALGNRAPEGQARLAAADAIVQFMGGDLRSAAAGFRQASTCTEGSPGAIDADQRDTWRRLEALTLIRLGQWDAGEAKLRMLLPRALAVHGPEHPATLLLEYDLVQAPLARGDAATAIARFADLFPRFQQVYGPTHRLTLEIIEQRATALALLGRYDAALADETTLYRAAVVKAGEKSFFAAGTLSDLADTQCRAGDLGTGIEDAERAYAIAKAAWGERNGGTAALRGTAAFCLAVGHRHLEAATLIDGLDIKAASEFMGDPSFGAEMDLARADIALAKGDRSSATRLMRMPLQTFRTAGADLFNRQWTNRLAAALSLPIGG